MPRGGPAFKQGEETGALIRGIQAEQSFKKLLGDSATKSDKIADQFDHYDFKIKFDVKTIRSVDEFGESNWHWVELMNINGNTGWLYGKSDYFAFETKNYWILVEAEKLREFIKRVVVNPEITFTREPYRIYRRRDRLDKVVMVSTLDLAFLGFMAQK
jgi:hypothetical protein